MRRDICTERAQRGMVLLESLVGMLILLLVVAATLTAMAHGARRTHENNLRAAVVDQLRAAMTGTGVALCGADLPLAAAQHSLAATVSCEPYAGVSVSFPGVAGAVTVDVPPERAQRVSAMANSPVVGGALTVSSH